MTKGQGKPGDLLIKITVEDHEVFRRDAENVLSEAYIPYTKAVFGGDVAVETLKGLENITLQPGTQDGSKATIRGGGMKHVTNKGSSGDHIITLRIDVPKDLSGEEQEALRRFAQLRGD